MDDLVAPSELCRNRIGDPGVVVDDAVWLIEHMCEHLEASDLGELDVLDFGCGVRFTQALVNRGLPIKHYVGVDVSADVIDFLGANVADPRFEYFHLDAHNALYNPTGQPLAGLTVPGIEGRQFDVICLFSVFTHLAPEDYVAMLRLLRRYVRPGGRLFYTLFVNELTEAGHGHADAISRALAKCEDPQVMAELAAAIENDETSPDFRDADPENPMMIALYSRRYATDLIKGSGWDLLSLSPPDRRLQHHILCAPDAP